MVGDYSMMVGYCCRSGKSKNTFHNMVVAFEGNMLAVVFEPALVAFADDKDDMEAVGILAVNCYGRLHRFRTVENDPRIQIGIGDTVEHVLADVFHRLVIRVFEGENQMVDAVLRGPDDFRSAIVRFIACGSSDQRDFRIVLAVALVDIVNAVTEA